MMYMVFCGILNIMEETIWEVQNYYQKVDAYDWPLGFRDGVCLIRLMRELVLGEQLVPEKREETLF